MLIKRDSKLSVGNSDIDTDTEHKLIIAPINALELALRHPDAKDYLATHLRRDKPARLNFGSTQKISFQDTPSSHAPAWEFIR